MENEAVLTKLDELRKSMEAFNQSLDRVRYDEFKTAFYEQIQGIFARHGDTLLESGMETMSEFSSCNCKRECMMDMVRLRDETLGAFRRDDLTGALLVLEAEESRLTGEGSPCTDRRCSRYTLDTIHQIKALFSISDNLKFRNYIQPETSFTKLSPGRPLTRSGRERKERTPTEIANALTPLSNPWRVEILKLLSLHDRSFSEMSKALDLKTGHLQFHLRVLQKSGLIKNNSRRRVYSISVKGSAALDGVQALVERLG